MIGIFQFFSHTKEFCESQSWLLHWYFWIERSWIQWLSFPLVGWPNWCVHFPNWYSYQCQRSRRSDWIVNLMERFKTLKFFQSIYWPHDIVLLVAWSSLVISSLSACDSIDTTFVPIEPQYWNAPFQFAFKLYLNSINIFEMLVFKNVLHFYRRICDVYISRWFHGSFTSLRKNNVLT